MAFNKPHSSNLFYLAICGICILAFIVVGIYPNHIAMGQMDEEINTLRAKIQSQKLLHPIYMKLIQQMQQKQPEGLPLPEKKTIDKDDIESINDKFFSIAQSSAVSFETAAPDPSSYLEETSRLTMNVVFSGDFFNLRRLLMNISQQPYLNNIDQLEMTTVGDRKQIRLKLILDQT